MRTARSVMCAFADCGCVRLCFFCCVDPFDGMPATGWFGAEPDVQATITSAVTTAMPTSAAINTPPWTRR